MCLIPWPGCGRAWSTAYCAVANVVVAPVVSAFGPDMVFRRGEDDASAREEAVPWRVYVYARQESTGRIDRTYGNRRLPYVSIAALLALTVASRLRGHRTRWMWLAAIPLLTAILAAHEANFDVLTLDRWRWISLPGVVEIAMSAAYAFIDGLPAMTFVIPVVLWWLALRAPAFRAAGASSGTPRRP
jgi:hypothetical protein